MAEIPIRVNVNVEESVQQFSVSVSDSNIPVSVEVATPVVASIVEDYDGDTEATPSAQDQVFSVGGKRVLNDFVVHAIPNNYGLITYNGQYITVS